MQHQATVRVHVEVSDDGHLVAHVAGCPGLLRADDVIELREKVEQMVRATFGEGCRLSLVV